MKRTHTPARSGRTAVTVHIDDLAPGGFGVGHIDTGGESRAVFVPRVAVGDEVDLEVDLASRPAKGRVLRLLGRGPGRVDAPCAHVEACGACDWMHLSRDTQRETRADHLRRALPAPFRDVPVCFHDAAETLGYRARARLHARASGGRAIIGLHGLGSHDVIEVKTCLVLHPAIDAAIPQLAAVLEGAHGEGEAHVALGVGEKPVVALHWHGRIEGASFGRIERAVESGTWAGASVYLDGVRRPAVVGDAAPRMMGADGRPLVLAPEGFAQASSTGNLVLANRVLELATAALGNETSRASVVELYAGAGNFTILLARGFGSVVAVESDAAACDAARKNLAVRALTARVTCADADEFAVPRNTDLVLLDPPRRGARKACEALAASSVKAIVYVSCDAPTLGRDLGALSARFEPVAVESFAMFPGTSHSETIVTLRRVRARTRAEPQS
jgi:23S rRNA (uracil1939-C5)-methyltransferase